jgi:hypothetical protein
LAVREEVILRIDLTDYRPYIGLLVDRLNDDGAYRMSMTDAVKIAVEQAVERLVPDVVITRTRKKYVKIPF